MKEPDIRCTACGSEFASDDLPHGVAACPACYHPGVPMAIKDDVEIKINTHELRILCMWADNYAQNMDDAICTQSQHALQGIIGRLTRQLPGVALTLGDEFQQVADTLQTEVEISGPQGSHTVKPRKPN